MAAFRSAFDGAIHGVARESSAHVEAEQRFENESRRLEMRVAECMRDLGEARAETLQLLAVASWYRDDESPEHTETVGLVAGEVAMRLGLSAQSAANLREAAPLHDIGKLAIPDSVLLNRRSLTAEQEAVMETHTTLGARLLFGSRSPVLQLAGTIAESHHERWDGMGYPKGLIGEDIPLVGRVVAVADAFDTLTRERGEDATSTMASALAAIEQGAGAEFDPRVAAAFLSTDRAVAAAASEQPPQRSESALPRRARRHALRSTPSPAAEPMY
jgi:putative two-component system response regulator